VLTAIVAISQESSSVNEYNHIRNRAADREHPRKRLRPLAQGTLQPRGAALFGIVLGIAALLIAWQVATAVFAIVVVYMLINIGYSFGLKNIAILDVFIIASGFMLRIFAGTAGVGIEPSHWLVLCGLMTTTFLGFAKRRAELMVLDGESSGHRPVLQDYTPALLDNMIAASAAGVVVTYSLYTVDEQTIAVHGTPYLIYTVPFVLYGIFRYMFLLHVRGGGGDPARELLRDPHLALAGFGWLATVLWLLH
jgi:4-hydroxybenzoate polyprenyltransferase